MELCNEKNCCGCGLCVTICPKKAITLKENQDGYIYPIIDQSKCINCGLCKKKCIFQSESNFSKPILCLAGQNSNIDEEKRSASGGIFYAIGKRFIEKGGWVCGAVLDTKGRKADIHHIVSNDLNDLKRMQGSKYVQSDISNIINTVHKLINSNNKVLFCGTPCQNAAIRKKIGDSEKLFLIDIICHGVPSLKMFNDFLNTKLNKNEVLDNYIFRDKTYGKGYVSRKSILKGGRIKKIYKPAHLESFYHLFLKSYIFRNNCYECPFAKSERVSDITIGDYWGIEKYYNIENNSINLQRSCSCILINTDLGKKMFYEYGKDIDTVQAKLEEIRKANVQLNHPSKYSRDREEILEVYRNNGYKAVENYYRKRIGRVKYWLLTIRYALFKY